LAPPKAEVKQARKRQRGDGPVKDFFKKPKAEPAQPGSSAPIDISVKKETRQECEDDHDVIVLD